MKILGICGSPRQKGNTEYLINYSLEQMPGMQTEIVALNDKNIAPCSGCYQCAELKRCAIKDDFEEIFAKMIGAHGIVLGSPVYHGGVTANLKALLDRAGFLGRWINNKINKDYQWKGTPFSKKVGAAITVARRAGYITAYEQLLLWFTVNDFIVVGSHYWNMGIAGKGGAVNIEEDEEGKNIVSHMAKNMAFVVEKINA